MQSNDISTTTVPPHKPFILGIAGRAGAGKDTFAEAFRQAAHAREKTTLRYGFADPLKKACEVLFGGDGVDHWWTQEGKAAEIPFWAERLGEKYSSGRNILGTVGTGVFRYRVNQRFWLMVAEWQAFRSTQDIIVIADVRFDNEAAWIREMGGAVIEVVNSNQKPQRRAGAFVGWLRKVPVIGESKLVSQVLIKFGYAAHPSEDGISPRYISRTYVSGSREQTEAQGSEFAKIYDFPCREGNA